MRLNEDWTLEWQRERETVFVYKQTPLRPGELSSVDIGMLRSCRIRGLLPIDTEGSVHEQRLAYRVSGLRPLLQAIQSERFDREQWRRLLLAVCTVLQDLDRYLLLVDRVILWQETIWIGRNLDDVSLLYFPITDAAGKSDSRAELQQLAKLLLDHVRGHRGFHEIELLHSLKREPFDRTAWMSRWAHSFDEEDLQKDSADPEREKGLELLSAVPHMREASPPMDWGLERSTEASGKGGDDRFAKPAATALIALLAAVWTLFGSSPTEGTFYVCAGFTLLAADGYAFALRRTGSEWISRLKHRLPVRLALRTVGTPEFAAEPSPVDTAAYYVSLPDRTTLLVPPADATALLPASAVWPTAELQIERGNGEPELYTLTGSRTVIGKKAEAVQLLQDEAGVSRVHAEITLDPGGCLVRDLGSTNGTFLNGDRLEPLQAYPFADGDRLRIVGTSYILRMCERDGGVT